VGINSNKILCIPVALMLLLAVTVVPTIACTPGIPCANSNINFNDAKVQKLPASCMVAQDIIGMALTSPSIIMAQDDLANKMFTLIEKRGYVLKTNNDKVPIALLIYSNGTSYAAIVYSYNATTGAGVALLIDDTIKDMMKSDSSDISIMADIWDPLTWGDQEWLCFFSVVACFGAAAGMGWTCGSVAVLTLAAVLPCVAVFAIAVGACGIAAVECSRTGWL